LRRVYGENRRRRPDGCAGRPVARARRRLSPRGRRTGDAVPGRGDGSKKPQVEAVTRGYCPGQGHIPVWQVQSGW
jgi:hypothetical protein